MTDRNQPAPVTLTPEEARGVALVLQMVVEDEIEFALGDDTATFERADARISGGR